jgi:serine/threonine protein kinase
VTTGAGWERLRALFEGALEHPADQRTAFLVARTDGDEALRREVESLLAAHDASERFLEEPVVTPHGDRPADRLNEESRTSGARFAAGDQLGAFEILEPLGIGGMGEVYRARDTRLDRFVAIKVLSSELEIDAYGRQRFEREARAISKLSHPHICTVHDVGSATVNGTTVPFLVMELLDGETLAIRLASGPLSVEQALRYAIDIVDALVAAHSHGIVHRDLKPANVMVSRSSGVKLLDFGLAQLRGADGAGPLSSNASDGRFTSAGMVFGTLPYMSPEQLRGEQADARTDIFAFGALLHEMLTGIRPFVGDSQAELIGAILERDPPSVSDLQPLAPASLDRLVRKCLAKHLEDRWQTARDLRSELQWILEEPSRPGPAKRTRRASTGRLRHRLVVGAATITACVVGGLFGLQLATRSSTPSVVTHLSLNFPAGVTLNIPINGISFAISPDGSRVAYIGVRRGQKSIFVQALNTGTTVEIPGTAEAANPTFSPDSQWLAFVQSGAVKKVPAAGGPIQVVCVCTGPLLRWLSDGRLVRSGLNRPIQDIVAAGRPITQLAEGDEGHHTPILLPNGSLLFMILRGGWHSAVNSVAVWASNGSSAQEIVANATSPALVGGDTIVFSQGHTFYAARFDVQRMRLAGEARALELRVQPNAFAAAPMYAVAANGTLVYAELAAGRRLVWVDRQGREEFVKTDERFFAQVRISPDGTRVATYLPDGDRDIWVFGLTRPTVDKLTSGPARDTMPVWSPDGSRIFFTTGENRVRSIAADRSAGVVSVFDGPRGERIHPLAMSPDGTQLLIQWDQMPRRIEQRVLHLGPTPELLPLVGESGTERDGRLSPDGRWLAFQSDESSQGLEGHISVRPFPDVSSKRWVISPGVGRQPIWSRDGRELFYRTEDGTVMSVQVQTKPSFFHEPPVPVVTPQWTLRDWANGPTYDVSPDGRRFLFIKAPELDIHSLHIVLNWDVEVKARLGGSD